MTAQDNLETIPSQGTKVRRPNWTKLHLIYFALAAFDLAAVGTGLWLSRHTNAMFAVSVEEIEVADAIRDNATAALTAALELGKPANEVFNHRDTVKARADLKAAITKLEQSLASDHDAIELRGGAEEAGEEAGHDHGHEAGAELVAEIHVGLNRWMPDKVAEFERIESQILAAKAEIVTQTTRTIELVEDGKLGDAVLAMDASDAALGKMIMGTVGWLDLSDHLTEQVVAQSVEELSFGERLQYIIGTAILAMVLMVVVYAHFMGRVLRRKFEEIETAQQESDKLSSQLRVVNDDISNLNVELAKNVKSLVEAQEEIVRKGKLAQLGQLTATVAHELRNPLGAVRTAAFLALRKVQGKGTGIEPQLDRVATGVTRCDSIITQLLDFSRSTVTAVESKDLDTWLIGVLEEQAQAIPAAVAMEVAAGLGGQHVEFDEGRLRRAIINLVSNASEAMVGKGNDPATFTTPTPKVVIETRLGARGAEIIVSDNGPGIQPEHLEKVLEPLFTTKNFGTGLGLPAVQRIMEQHGGGLEVHSEFGKGARFTAWLPLVQASVDQAKAA